LLDSLLQEIIKQVGKKMQLQEIVAEVQSRLLLNEQQIKNLEQEKKEVISTQVNEEQKIEEQFQVALLRLEKARNSFLAKLDEEATRRLDAIKLKKQTLNSASLALSPELITIQQVLMDEKGTAIFDVSSCQDRVLSLLKEPNEQENNYKFPAFFPSPTLAVMKTDFGFLQLTEFLPQDFQLVLTNSASNCMTDSLAACSVLCLTGQFTKKVKDYIQFTVEHQGRTTPVPIFTEMSEDMKMFRIAFKVEYPGVFSVTALLYGQHVQRSPLYVHLLPFDDIAGI